MEFSLSLIIRQFISQATSYHGHQNSPIHLLNKTLKHLLHASILRFIKRGRQVIY